MNRRHRKSKQKKQRLMTIMLHQPAISTDLKEKEKFQLLQLFL